MKKEQQDDNPSHSEIESWFHGKNVQRPKEKGEKPAGPEVSVERAHLDELLDVLIEKVKSKKTKGVI